MSNVSLPELTARIRVDTSSLDSVRKSADGFGSHMKGVFAGVGAAIAGAFVLTKAVDFFGDAIKEATEAAKVSAQTAAAIKSTGSAAHVSAAQVGELATALSNKTGIDDEAIQSASNLLLTFTKVRNEAGKGNDIFNQSTAILADMATALGTDVSGSAIQLGKALNDPVKGITALTRVGVTFDDQQKKQIKTMTEAGNLAGAQKIILAELTKEFGGSAEAVATPAEKMKVAWSNLKEQIGTGIIPALAGIATFATEKVLPALSTMADKIEPLIKKVVLGIRGLAGAFQNKDVTSDGFVGVMERIGVAARKVFDVVNPVVQKGIDLFKKEAIPLIKEAADAFKKALKPAIDNIVKSYQDNKEEIDKLLKVIGLVVGAIIVYAIPALIQMAAMFVQIEGVVVPALITAIGWLVRIIEGLWTGIQAAAGFIVSAWNVISTAVTSAVAAVGTAVSAVQTFLGNVVGFFQALPGRILEGIKALPGMLGNLAIEAIGAMIAALITAVVGVVVFFQNLPGWIITALNATGRLAERLFNSGIELLQGLWDGAKNVFAGVVQWFTDLPGNALGALSALGRLAERLFNAGVELVSGLFGGAKQKGGEATSWFKNLPQMLLDGIYSAGKLADKLFNVGLELIQGLIDGIKKKAGEVVTAIKQSITDKLPQYVKDHLGIKSPSTVMMALGQQVSLGFAKGITNGAGAIESAMSAVIGIPNAGSVGVSLSGGSSVPIGSGGDIYIASGAIVLHGLASDGSDLVPKLTQALRAGVGRA